MLVDLKKKAAVIVYVGTLLLSTAPMQSQAKPAQQTGSTQGGTSTYQQAKKDLSSNMYVLYRVVDRIARANELDRRPWRVKIEPKYDINAFATEVNLIAVHTGILDQLAGDSSALACIVAHEMGHHVKRHIAIGAEQQTALVEGANQEVEQEARTARTQARVEETANDVARDVGNNVLGNVSDGLLRNVGGSIFGGILGGRTRSAQERQQEIIAKKQEDLEKRIAEANRVHEYEADEVGYLYATRAGFEPEGCIRALNVVGQLPGTQRDSTHPATPKRIEALKAIMAKHQPQTLATEGKARISATQPLTYQPSEDRESLRVNSRNGGSSQDDLDRLFGE